MNNYIKGLEQRCEELQDTVSSQNHSIAKLKASKVLRIPSLNKDWSDRDHVLISAVFTVLEEFIEKEWKSDVQSKLIDIDDTMTIDVILLHQKENNEKKELFELYQWWKNEYPILEQSPIWHIKGYLAETEKAMRVVSLRKYMWT